MAEASYNALINKEVDSDVTVAPQQVADLEKLDYIQVLNVPSHGTGSSIFNMRRKPFDDPNFRLALSYAQPKRQMAEEVHFGFAQPGASMIAPINAYWHNPDIKPYPFDIIKAKEILKKSGYRWNEDGRLCYPSEQ
jgi:peptide/nickel transport system substrate-binding protein